MLQRKIERKLLDWKRQPNHKPLIINSSSRAVVNAERHTLLCILLRFIINKLCISIS